MLTSPVFVNAVNLHKILASDQEFALLDVREQEEFAREHILLATCAPASHLEERAPALVPCRNTELIIMDDGNSPDLDRAARAWHTLSNMGYENLKILAGGLKSWLEAGFVTVNGIGSLSKGFGEYIEVRQNTPNLPPEEIKKILDDPEQKSIVIDVRPVNEYNNMNIPGSINLPGCEVAYRIAQIPLTADTTIIINCAGRTRSIIGTQTLINYGLANKIFALRGGTMNWQLAGFGLDYGSKRELPALAPDKYRETENHIRQLGQRYGVKYVDMQTLRAWEKEREQTTLYIFDVRQPDEYAQGHLPGSISAQGGQLIQATDEYAAVRNGRYVLVDNDELRAIVVAHWLGQMGLPRVYVLKGGIEGQALQYGPQKATCQEPLPAQTCKIAVMEAKKLLENDPEAICLDLGESRKHRKGHIPGAKWLIRAYLPRAKEKYPDLKTIIITSDTVCHAALGAIDAKKLWPEARVYFIEGGTTAWKEAALPLEEGMNEPLCPEDDVWYRPYTDINASPEAMREYFNWESRLVAMIEQDNCVKFNVLP